MLDCAVSTELSDIMHNLRKEARVQVQVMKARILTVVVVLSIVEELDWNSMSVARRCRLS
jgi:hypothetical protein